MLLISSYSGAVTLAHLIGWLLVVLATAGIGYSVVALVAINRFARQLPLPAADPEPVTLLKPLHGAEPRLAENLATFAAQDWPAPIEMIAGIQNPGDPARLGLPPGARLVVDGTPHGANAKVSNLINMLPAARHDLLVMSDSDIAVPRDYLARLAATLAQPGVGAVTCLYRGRGDAGFWSVLAGAAVSYHFLPGVLVSLSLGNARACMGSTIALRRETLARLGGFQAFADVLADDYAIGAGVRALGREVAMAPMVLVHASAETSLAALWRHELRWAATVREVVSWPEYLGLAVTQPLAPALLALPLLPGPASVALGAALLVRTLLVRRIDRWCGERTAPLWLMPLRDLLSAAVFFASFGVRSVDWRGQRLRIADKGRITARSEPR